MPSPLHGAGGHGFGGHGFGGHGFGWHGFGLGRAHGFGSGFGHGLDSCFQEPCLPPVLWLTCDRFAFADEL